MVGGEGLDIIIVYKCICVHTPCLYCLLEPFPQSMIDIACVPDPFSSVVILVAEMLSNTTEVYAQMIWVSTF